MAENSGGGSGLYFIVGALVVVVTVIGFVTFGGHFSRGHGGGSTASAPKVELNVNPAAGK